MRYACLLIFIFISHLIIAQEEQSNSCVQNIEIAQQRYDEGRIQDIQNLLNSCLEAGNYTKAEEGQALRLLTLAYIFLDDEPNAEATMLRLLETNHEFEVNPVIDPTEFINLHSRYRTKPLFNIGIRYIVNFAQPIVTELNSTLSLTGERPDYSLIFNGFGIGLNFEYEFARNFLIYPEVHFKSMSIANTFEQNGIINTDKVYFKLEYFEDQQWISLPVSVKYIFDLKRIPDVKIYTNLGVAGDFLVKTSLPSDGTTLNTVDTDGESVDPQVGFTLDSKPDHRAFNFGAFAGVGFTWKMGEGFFSLEGRYQYSFTKFTKPEYVLTPTNAEQINTGAQHDIYRLNHIAISVGYTMNMYFPKKMK